MSSAILKFRNPIFLATLVLTNTFGNFLVAKGLNAMPAFEPSQVVSYSAAILTNVAFVSGVVLLIIALIAQLSMFTWADLSYVLPMTAFSYAITALLGKFFLGEIISAARWAGIALISGGVILVAETPPWTHNKPPGEEEP